MAKKERKDNSELKWFITVFITTFVLSIGLSYVSTKLISSLDLFPALVVLILTIFVGILFDIIGIAVTVAEEEELHAKASKKIKGAKTSIKLIRNSSKVANICADVVGDICGVLSGTLAALISIKITARIGAEFNMQFIISAIVAAITVGGKALGKNIAKKNSTKIVHAVGIIVNKATFEIDDRKK